jgi:hypothetical protein
MTAIVRTPFTTSRLLEFCTVTELTKLVGCEPVYWPVVVVKEISDNALDACEEAGIAPEIIIAISTKKGTISITDNGPGIPPDTVAHLLDYHTKTSSREAYVGPTRGAQGNALQALLAMPFALDGTKGESVIEACGVAHHISFDIDPVRREPEIEHSKRCSLVQSGTRVTLRWPNSAIAHSCSTLGTKLYKSSTASRGSIHTPALLCSGTASACSLCRRRSRLGASGGRVIMLRRFGTTRRASAASSLLASLTISTMAAIAP